MGLTKRLARHEALSLASVMTKTFQFLGVIDLSIFEASAPLIAFIGAAEEGTFFPALPQFDRRFQ